jgi:putative sigma-54 modulation protein
MEIQIVTKNLEVTPHLEDYVEKKISKLDRFLPELDEVRVDLAVENTRSNAHSQVAQLTIWIGKTVLRAEERDADMFAAIDASLDKMQRQISRFRKRRQKRRQRSEQVLVEMEESEEPDIARVKRFEVRPMSPEEAIEQMELLGHEFFVFLNPEEGNINAVYRRKNKTYGLLIPQME